MRNRIRNTKNIILNNKKVIENYFFMTVLQVLNSLFYLIIYPFLIRKLGAESYGLYVFAMSVVSYFVGIVNFGFDMPAVKSIAQNSDNNDIKSNTLSCVFTAKIYLEIFSFFVFGILIFSIPTFHSNWQLYFICFATTLSNILFPQWFFQGLQKMRIVTFIQLLVKLLSLPFIFLFVKSKGDIYLFSIIATVTTLLSSIIAYLIIRFKEKLIIKFVSLTEVKLWYKDALPFFWSNSFNILKQQSTTIIVGTLFGMKDVALYDLAMKIFQLPIIIFSSVNSALFPKMVQDVNKKRINNIIKLETLMGVSVILFLIIFGKIIITILGGVSMINAYPLLVALSFSVFTILTVGAIFSFIFVPSGLYKFIAYNQTLALLGFFVFMFIGLLVFRNIIIVPLSITFSSFVEILYCYFLLKRVSINVK